MRGRALTLVVLTILMFSMSTHPSLAGGCSTLLQNPCTFIGSGKEGGYSATILSGGWEIYHLDPLGEKIVDMSGSRSQLGPFAGTAGVRYYGRVTGTGVLIIGQP